MSPRSIGPFEILESVNTMVYILALPPSLSGIPCVYTEQVSSNPSHVLDSQPVELREDMSYEVQLVEIVDCQVRRLQSKEIALVKVVWSGHPRKEAMWRRCTTSTPIFSMVSF